MKKYILFTVMIALTSCSNLDETEQDGQQCIENNFSNIPTRVLQERDSSLTTILSKRKYNLNMMTRATASDNNADNYIGYSYKVEEGNSILGDVMNIGYPVVDLKRYEARYPSAVKRLPAHVSGTEVCTFADLNRIDHQSSYSKKIKTGFSFDVKLFKVSREKVMHEKFNSYLSNSSQNVYGELSAYVHHKYIEMTTASNALNRCAADYLDELFIDALYSSTMVDILKHYGEFVTTGYFTGGRASALYCGKSLSVTDSTKREKELSDAISSTFKSNSNSTEMSIGTTKESDEMKMINKFFSTVEYTAHTIGGSYGYPIITTAKNIDNISNFSQWLASLDMESTHTLVDLGDNCLYPLSDFMLEENFKARYEDTQQKYLSDDEFVVPYIDIMRVFLRKSPNGTKLYTIAPVLTTRQGDKIILSNKEDETLSDAELLANNTFSVFNAKAEAIKNSLKNVFKLQIKQVYSETINPILRNPLAFQVYNVNFSAMKKFINTNSNVTYFYDTNSRVCFSFFGDYILEDYGLDTWFDNIDTASKSMQSLYQGYRIFGL